MKAATLVCLGFVFGGLIGAQFAVDMPEIVLRRLFGGALLAVALRMILFY